jgi:alanine racemase
MSYLEINLRNVAANFKLLQTKVNYKTKCGAAIKANAYGLGIEQIAQTLERSGCQNFFVAHIDEALTLRKQTSSNIYLLHGIFDQETAKLAANYKLTPVLNSLEQVAIYNDYANSLAQKLPAILNFDTGMGRLGIVIKDIQNLKAEFVDYVYVMSHLACADEPEHLQNKLQLQNLKEITKLFPETKVSFANSAGIFLGKDYHYDLIRPGCAIYGINPTPAIQNPMKTVVTIQAKIIQRRTLDHNQYIGYGASYLAKTGSKVFIVEYGYGDGYFRNLSNTSKCYVDGFYLDVIGRISMDLIICDASPLPESIFQQVTHTELLGDHIKLDELAKQSGTIGYEILTNLSPRYQRHYVV